MGSYTSEQLAFDVTCEVEKIKVNMSQLNMMVIGKTGVGKSTLINGMFGEDLAPTGTGFPVTLDISSYSKNNYPFVIMDWPGFELDGENGIDRQFDSIKKIISYGVKSKRPHNMIHCIIYCISGTGHRFEDAEIHFIKKLLEETGKTKIPVICVITQALLKKDTEELIESIEVEGLPFADIVPVLVQDVDLGDYVKKAYGLDRLAASIGKLIADDLKNTLECVQQVNIRMMTRRAMNNVNSNAAKAMAMGLKPIFKMKDIYPVIVTMLANITAIYDISIDMRLLNAIPELVDENGTAEVKQNRFFNVVKFIEPITYLTNSAIIGTQAASAVAALGEEFIKIMNNISTKEAVPDSIDHEKFICDFEERYKAKIRRRSRKDDGKVKYKRIGTKNNAQIGRDSINESGD